MVVLEYMKGKSTTEIAKRLPTLYHGSNGFNLDGAEISVWFDEQCIHIASGKTAQFAPSRQVIAWETAAERIGQLLEHGQFATNVELAEAPGYERNLLAQQLWYLYHDFSSAAIDAGYLPSLAENPARGYPAETAWLAEQLDTPEFRQSLTEEYTAFQAAYRENRNLLRFHHHKLQEISDSLHTLSLPRIAFSSALTEIPTPQQFITQDEIDTDISRGSGFAGGKVRIFAFFQENHTEKEKAAFLKHEYGLGGHSHALSGAAGSSEDHNSKGILYQKDGCPEVRFTWEAVSKRITELIRQDRYLTREEQAEYDKIQAEKALGDEAIAASIEHVQTDLPSPESAEPLPVGRIDFLGTNGDVGESVEYTDAEKLVAAIKEENYFGVPMRIVLYRDSAGHTIPRDFLKELDPPPQGFEITDTAIRQAEPPDTEKVAEYLSDQERIAVFRYPNGQFYNHYGYHEQIEASSAVAGGFDTFEEAQATVYAHRPKAEKVLEPAEKAVDMARDTDSTVDGRIPDREMAPTLSVPRPRARVSPSVLHPEQADRHDHRITNDALGVGTPSERYQNNIAAIRLLKQLEREERLATPEEQEILSRYVGWGGLADCFEETHRNYLELKNLLTPEEYAAARESTLTAFYTPPVVIRSMYQALEQMGFETGNILEPSCGTGNFLGMIPERMSSSKRYGIELDEISGQIARQLYQTASVTINGYEKTDLPDSFFDVAIGNIPCGNFKVADRRYNKHNFLIHDYFFGKMLDKVRPGGIVAFVTSKGTMDKENPAVRKYIAQRADLLGAIRLPNNTFKGAASTEVTSDILFLQKRDSLMLGPPTNHRFVGERRSDGVNELSGAPGSERYRVHDDAEPDWVHLGVSETGLKMNQYFLDHPEMILGEMQEVSGPYGPETACIPFDDQELSDLLTSAIGNIGGSIQEYEREEGDELEEDRSILADPTVRNFSYTIVDGEVYYRENSRMNPVEVSTTALGRIKGLIGLRDCVRQLIEYQTEDYPEHFITTEQQKLNNLYDSFVKKYGRISQRANNSAFHDDNSYFLLTSLEVTDSDGNFVRKADMFTKRTIKQKLNITRVDTASEALALSLAEKAGIDIPYMTDLTGKDEATLVEELRGVIFQLPDMADHEGHPIYVTADEYLSGNVRKKLRQAEQAANADPQFRSNVEALKAVQPVDLTASEISVRLGATWLPPEDVARFLFELFDTPGYARYNIKVHYSKLTGTWNIEGKSYDRSSVKANSTYGTNRINGYKIIEETLNLKDVRIFDYVEDAEGRKTAVLNKKETAIAQAKQQLIKQAFADWIWKDPERRERLCKLYNETFNSVRPREYDGSHLNFVGINPEIKLRPHQVNAIAHILYGGNTLLAHVVGAGKTFEIVAAAQESKRLGLCSKSLIAVPNHLTEQWATEYLQLYPSANILVATKKDFEPKNRKRFCGRIATGDYDAIIIGHSQLEKIPMSIERQRAILEEQLQEVMDGISDLKQSRGDNFSIKQMERTKKGLKAKLDKLNDQSRKDDVVTFEELGVDRLFVDEAHNYKNLAAYTKMRNVGGISQTEAQKSSDLYMKCRYLDELTGGRGVVFATGTPISNSMVEMYTMQKYLQHDTLQGNDLLHFDAWASTFGETVTAIELAPEGTGYRAKTRFAKFYNLPELMSMFKEVADIQTADMLNLPVPKANYHHVVLKPSEHQKEMVADLSERAERVRNKMVDSSQDNMLLITNDGRKLALDQRMVNPLLPDSDTGKVSACADNIFAIWQRTAEQKSTQLAFCDLSTPKSDGTFNVYDDLRDKLIARGIPAEQIAYIHNANTEQQKKELFGKVCAGEVRVLLGSTAKMGAGTNVQKKLIALHHLDCPWRPADLQQREGRIIRQGNENKEVEIYTYVTENTFDSYLFQLVESKQKFIRQIMTSKSPVRSAEDIDETALSYLRLRKLYKAESKSRV